MIHHPTSLLFYKLALLLQLLLLLSCQVSISVGAKYPEVKPPQPEPEALSECLATDLEFSEYYCLASPEPLPISCVNNHQECQAWADRGECQKNPQYMLLDCRKACNTCIPLHGFADYNNVPQIAPVQESRQQVLERLRDTQRYIHEEALRTVEVFKTCRNLSSMCTYWSLIGECERNPSYMEKECAAACRTCHKL